jgi:hypothetical protein
MSMVFWQVCDRSFGDVVTEHCRRQWFAEGERIQEQRKGRKGKDHLLLALSIDIQNIINA